MEKTIRGKIIRILDNKTVVINLGSHNGVDKTSIFSILGTSEKIVDPFTKEDLGQVLVVKSRVKANQVYPKFTIAKSQWKETETSYPNIDLFKGMGIERKLIDVGKDLNTDQSQIQPWKAVSEEPVRIGDTVSVVITTQEAENPKNPTAKKKVVDLGTSAKKEAAKKTPMQKK